MRLCLLVFVCLTLSTLCFSSTLNVPGDYKSIQLAIDAASSGDSILVAPGIYVEDIDFKGKAITVNSSGGPGWTVIRGTGSADVVTFENGEGLDSVLRGFKITAGFGIHCFGASPTIENNIIQDCLIYGISCIQYASPSIVGNTITKNWQGINCDLNSSPVIRGNVITWNDSTPGPDQGGTRGGGIFANEQCSPLVMDNVIARNKVYGGYNFMGGWIPGSGGGIYSSGAATMVNNTIFGNRVEHNGGDGGGICCGKETTIVNSIIWNNFAQTGSQISGSPGITYSDVQGGWGGTGNISSDPLFMNPVIDDFHLTYPSPCRDTGDNTAVNGLYDFEGDPRIYQGTVDMGADEFYTHLYVTGDKTPGGAIQGKFVGLPGTTPVGLFVGSGILPSPMNTMWGEYWLQAPWILFGPLGAIPSNGVMVLPATLPTGMTVPVDIPMQALIGLNADSLTNLCVLEVR